MDLQRYREIREQFDVVKTVIQTECESKVKAVLTNIYEFLVSEQKSKSHLA